MIDKPCYVLGRTTIERVANEGALETDNVVFVAADDLFHRNSYAQPAAEPPREHVPKAEHVHRPVGGGDYGGHVGNDICADCGADMGEIPEAEHVHTPGFIGSCCTCGWECTKSKPGYVHSLDPHPVCERQWREHVKASQVALK